MTARVLVHRQGSLGDTVIALPCFHLIRAAFPAGDVRVLTNSPVGDRAPALFSILDGAGLVDGFFEYPVSLRDWRGIWRLARLIRQWRPDTAVYLMRRMHRWQVLRDAAFLWACGVRRFIGLPLTRDLLEPRRRADGSVEREAERLARCLAPLGAADLRDPAAWDLGLTAAERAVPEATTAGWTGLRSYIALGAGSKQAINIWGDGNWRALIGALIDAYPHRIVIIGGMDDRALAEEMAGNWPDRCVNLCGALGVRESAAVIAAASLFIGADSGPMHLAAASGTPLVGIFSKLNPPGLWFPPGDAARMLYPYADGATIASILPTDVLDAAATLLPIDGPSRQQASSG